MPEPAGPRNCGHSEGPLVVDDATDVIASETATSTLLSVRRITRRS
jgi:hypothetical protein